MPCPAGGRDPRPPLLGAWKGLGGRRSEGQRRPTGSTQSCTRLGARLYGAISEEREESLVRSSPAPPPAPPRLGLGCPLLPPMAPHPSLASFFPGKPPTSATSLGGLRLGRRLRLRPGGETSVALDGREAGAATCQRV